MKPTIRQRLKAAYESFTAGYTGLPLFGQGGSYRFPEHDFEKIVGAVVACMQLLTESTKPTKFAIVSKEKNKRFQDMTPESMVKFTLNVLEEPAFGGGDYTPDQFWELMTSDMISTGNSYAWIERRRLRGGERVPVSLHPALPSSSHVTWQDGMKIYNLTFRDYSTGATYAKRAIADDVLHFRGYTYDGLASSSPLAILSRAMEMNRTAWNIEKKMLKNKTRSNLVLESPGGSALNSGDADQREKLINDFTKQMVGEDNYGVPPHLIPGVEAKFGNLSREDQETLAALRASVLEICAVFGVPVQLIPIVEKEVSTKMSNNDAMVYFFNRTVSPHLLRMEKEIDAKLLTMKQRQMWRTRLTGENRTLLVQEKVALAGMFARGVMTQNEVRDSLDMALLDDEKYNVLHENPMGAGYGDKKEKDEGTGDDAD